MFEFEFEFVFVFEFVFEFESESEFEFGLFWWFCGKQIFFVTLWLEPSHSSL